jgi:predicted DNA-binding protein with PD1-like motif
LKIVPVDRTRHFLLRLHEGDTLPETLLKQLRDRRVTGGWLRLTGVLSNIELCAFSSEIEGPGGTKRFAGPMQAVVLDGSLGIAEGGVAASLRVVLARESDAGLETIAGQLLRARVIGLEGSMTVLEETVVPRGLDKAAGVWLLRDDAVVTSVAEPPRRQPAAAPQAGGAPAAPPSWTDTAAAASSTPLRPPASALARQAQDADEPEDGPYPQAGDIAEHFAFGPCEVLRSDGDRLQVRMMRDGKVSEIALEKLRVTTLPPDGTTQRYRLSRKT